MSSNQPAADTGTMLPCITPLRKYVLIFLRLRAKKKTQISWKNREVGQIKQYESAKQFVFSSICFLWLPVLTRDPSFFRILCPVDRG
jgi:hypothetical protein